MIIFECSNANQFHTISFASSAISVEESSSLFRIPCFLGVSNNNSGGLLFWGQVIKIFIFQRVCIGIPCCLSVSKGCKSCLDVIRKLSPVLRSDEKDIEYCRKELGRSVAYECKLTVIIEI